MSSLENAIIGQMHEHRFVKYAWFVTMLGACGDIGILNFRQPSPAFHPARLKEPLGAINSKGKLMALMRFYITINRGLDDRLDKMPLNETINAGGTSMSNTPSEFILNPHIVTADEWEKSHELVRKGLIPNETLNTFLNIMGTLVVNEADCKKQWVEGNSVQARLDAVEQHLELNVACFALVMHFLRKNKNLNAMAKAGGFNLDDVAQAYPNVVAAARVVQIQDDLSDFVFDAMEELKTGLPTSNIVVAKLCEKLNLRSQDEYNAAIEKIFGAFSEKSSISFDELPSVVKSAIVDVHAEFRKAQTLLPPLTASLADSAWQTTISHGFKTRDPHHQPEEFNGLPKTAKAAVQSVKVDFGYSQTSSTSNDSTQPDRPHRFKQNFRRR